MCIIYTCIYLHMDDHEFHNFPENFGMRCTVQTTLSTTLILPRGTEVRPLEGAKPRVGRGQMANPNSGLSKTGCVGPFVNDQQNSRHGEYQEGT